MDDLISRQAAIDAFDGVKVNEENCTEYDIGYNDGIDFAVSKLSVLPSAEPKRGKWIYQIGMIKCDQCLRAIRRIDHDGLLNFCPNCGAVMREVTDG